MFGEMKNPQGERLDYTFHPGAADRNDLAILGHGVTGNKDRPFLTALADGLAKAGIPALRFSFSGNGLSEGRFEESTVSKEVEDLGAVIDSVAGKRVAYVGHSMGGAVGVLRASRDPRIEFLVSLAGMVHTHEFARREFGDVQPDQGCMWDKPECPLSTKFMEDMTEIGSVLDRAPSIKVPWLLVHGDADDVVPIQESREVAERTGGRARLVELKGADHVFSDDATPQLVETVVSWMKERMG